MITQKQIAQAAGVSRSTITRALRNDPQISLAQRERIQSIAAEMGYQNNPLVAALMTQVRSGKVNHYRGLIAYIVFGWTDSDWKQDVAQQSMYSGAQRRANELGYDLALQFYSAAAKQSLSKILWNKGIAGILVPAPQDENTVEIDLQWDRFSVVTLGFRLDDPSLHFASLDFFATLWKSLHILQQRGYKRPGLVLDLGSDSFAHFRLEGAMASFQINYLKPERRIPSLHLHAEDTTRLMNWWSTHHPDVILSNTPHALEILKSNDVVIPRDTGFLLLRHPGNTNEIAGVDRQNNRVGEAGVDIVTARINRNEIGIPHSQRGTLIESTFIEGQSLRKSAPKQLT